jgi:PhnB protein
MMAHMPDTALPTPVRHHDFAPAGLHTITPFVVVSGGQAMLDFYERAFGARTLSRMDGPDGTVLHAEIMIGDSVLQLGDPIPDLGLVAPGDTRTTSFVMYVPDVDATYAQALAAGATSLSSVEDVFSGDRMAAVTCPSGHRWTILTRVEDVAPEEIERRAREWVAAGSQHTGPDA